jgi:hypothetical protein
MKLNLASMNGKSVYQIADEDPSYVLWLYLQPFIQNDKKYKTFWPHVQSIAANHEKVKQLVNQYEKEQEAKELAKKKKEKQQDKEDAALAKKEWIGEVGERVKGVKVEVLRKHEFENQWGINYVTIMKDSDGNMIKHFGRNKLDKGDKKTVDFTVKKHDHEQVNQWNRVAYKVTLVNRVTVK